MSAPYAETAAEILAVSNDEDELRELIAESDRLLDVLETLNRDGAALTEAASKWTADLSDRVLGYPLPVEHRIRQETQAALDHVYDEVQTVLFKRHRGETGLQYIGITDEANEEPQP